MLTCRSGSCRHAGGDFHPCRIRSWWRRRWSWWRVWRRPFWRVGGFAGHGFASHAGGRFAPQHSSRGHYRFGRPYSYGDPYWYDYPYYGYYDYDDGDYSDAQASPSEAEAAEQTNIAVQQELAKRGFYQGPIDGSVGPETRKAISWFQSVEKLTVNGQVDGPTLDALQIR